MLLTKNMLKNIIIILQNKIIIIIIIFMNSNDYHYEHIAVEAQSKIIH